MNAASEQPSSSRNHDAWHGNAGACQDLTVERVFRMHANAPFARIPLYRESIDHISGIVRRRDLVPAMVEETPTNSQDLQGGHFRTRKRIKYGPVAFAFEHC